MKKNNDIIDLLKFIASILIFAMHCNFLINYPPLSFILDIISRWGVPFFFICSGYFLFNKSKNENIGSESLKRYIKRIALLYGAWFIINLPNTLYLRLFSKDIKSVNTWLAFLKEALLSSTFTGSWYLISSIFCAWFVYTLSIKIKTKYIIGISLIFYCPCVASSVYGGLVPTGTASVLSFLCFPLNIFNGCIYFSLGKMISEKKEYLLKKLSKPMLIICFIIAYLFFITEVLVSQHFHYFNSSDVGLFSVFIAISLFLLCLKTEILIKNGIILRKLSTIIYCSQANVLLFNSFLKRTGIPPIICFLLSCIIIAIICTFILFFQKRQWKPVRYLT